MSADADEVVMRRIVNKSVRFWIDEDNKKNVYVEFKRYNGAYCLVPYGDEYFLAFLGHQYREQTKEHILPNFDEILKIKRQDTIYKETNCITINRRVAGSLRDKIVYFLADDMWQSVVIKPDGWAVKLRTKTKFIKTAADLPQVVPVGGGDCLKLLRPYVNLPSNDFKLLVICLIQFFSRQSSHYAMVISSGRGTGKSTLTKLIRTLVDPSYSAASLTPNNDSELKNLLANSFVACFDNTAAMKDSYSNILCAAITGTREAKRKLYTDSDQVILNLHNIVILNGIDIVPYKSDLAERSLLFELRTISSKKRLPDSDYWSRFEKDKPAILGAVFDTLQKAMNILPTLEVDELDRMADAHREMIAIALALGISQENFKAILEANHEKLQAAYVQNNPFINSVVNYVNLRRHINDTATNVYEDMLRQNAGSSKKFPGSPSALSRKLNENKDILKDLGIHVDTDKKDSKTGLSYILLEKISQNKLTKSQQERSARFAALLSDDDASGEE